MTNLLSITAAPHAPVACDMTGAEDTLVQRMAEYRRLFDHALLGRDSTGSSTTFRLAARPGVQDWVLDLVRREAACCPFLSYEVDLVTGNDGDQVVWTTIGLGAGDLAVLDELLTDPGVDADSSTRIAQELEQRGGIPVIVPAEAG